MQLRRTPVNDNNGNVNQNYPLRPVALAHVDLAKAVADEVILNYNQIMVFSLIGLLILLAGTITFVNIQAAIGLRNTHAAGIRKSCGADMYLSMRRQSQLFAVLSTIALFISLLGLLGLACHAAVARTREVGIRNAWAVPAGV